MEGDGELGGMIIRTATGLIGWYIRAMKWRGWTSFWRVIYVLPGSEHDERLLSHEKKHLEQIERDGRLMFSIKYLWWLCLCGYHMNPYEIEARNSEDG